MSDKTRNYDATNFAIDKAIEDSPLAYVDYNDDASIVLDGDFSLAELRAIVAAIESVPLE